MSREEEAQDKVDQAKIAREKSVRISEGQLGQIQRNAITAEEETRDRDLEKERLNTENGHVRRMELEQEELMKKSEAVKAARVPYFISQFYT